MMDDIDRAVAACQPITADDWVNGFRLIQRKLRAMLTEKA